MKGFSYVYILVSDTDPKHYYVGLTEDLDARLRKLNKGGRSPYLQVSSLERKICRGFSRPRTSRSF